MEKLILRSIMWGAEKIPDHWFEKVPGSYYKAKEAKEVKKDATRPSTSGSGSGRGRRYSMGDSGRRPPSETNFDDYADDKKRSDDRRRRRHRDRHRESYDGMDEDYYTTGDDDHRPRHHRSERRRRSFDDRERFEYREDSAKSRKDDGYHARPVNGNQGHPAPNNHAGPRVDRYAPPIAAAATAAGIPAAAAASAAAESAPYPHSNITSPQPRPPQPEVRNPASVANGYVPYAHIYGSPAPPAANAPFSAIPPPSVTSSVPLNDPDSATRPIAPQSYQQDPYAQDLGAEAGYAANPGYAAPQDAGSQNLYDPSRYKSREDDRYEHRGHRRARSERRRREEEFMQHSESQGDRARERYIPKDYNPVESSTPGSTASGSLKTVDPRRPLNAQLRPDGELAATRRRRNERYDARYDDDDDDGRQDRRNARRHNSGYYSD